MTAIPDNSESAKSGNQNLKRKAFKPKSDDNSKKAKVTPFIKNKQKGGSKKTLPKETAKSRRDRKVKRKQKNENFELHVESKKIWEKLRVKKSEMSKDEKQKLVDNLTALVKSKDKELISLAFCRDTCRILQTCLKEGTRAQRQQLFQDFKSKTIDLSKNNYSKNIVWKMLKYGIPDERRSIIAEFKGHVNKLLRSSAPAASVIEYAYNNYANAQERDMYVRENYGNHFLMHEDAETKSLAEVLSSVGEDKKAMILLGFKDAVVPILQKSVVSHTIIHKILFDFFTHCDDLAMKMEVIELLRDSLVHMIHTHDGAHVTMYCLWHGTKKDRKVIIKSLKEHVIKLSTEEFGHLPLLAAFDCVDDTVFLKKTIIAPIIKDISLISSSVYGRKVLYYILAPRHKSLFLPEIIKLLQTGDDNASSKKSPEVRRSELSEAASPGIIKHITENVETLIFDKNTFLLVETAVLRCTTDTTALTDAIVQLVSKEFVAGEKDENDKMHVIEDLCSHAVVKKLISHQYDNDKVSFASVLLEKITDVSFATWSSCNRGSQLLLALVENKNEEVAAQAKKILAGQSETISANKAIKATEILLGKL